MASRQSPWFFVSAVLLVLVAGLAWYALSVNRAGPSPLPAAVPTSTLVATARPTSTPAALEVPPTGVLPAATPTLVVAPGPSVEHTLVALVPTLQAAAPTLSAIAESEQVQSVLRAATEVLGGAHLDLDRSPVNGPPREAEHVNVKGSDPSGTFGSLEPIAKLGASQAALILLGQVFPNARIELEISGSQGILVHGSKEPNRTPQVTLPNP